MSASVKTALLLCNGLFDIYLPRKLDIKTATIEHVVPRSKCTMGISDPHNLWLTNGKLNSIRSNFDFADLPAVLPSDTMYMDPITLNMLPVTTHIICHTYPCVSFAERTFYPAARSKGIIARAYLHLGKESRHMIRWHERYPAEPFEIERARLLSRSTGIKHRVL